MIRVAVVGKGGSGKSLVAGTLARLAARRGHHVLALDSDLMPGIAFTLGIEQPSTPPLLEAAERDENGRWRLKPGIGPYRAIQRYSTPAPDGIRLLQCGKVGAEGLPAIQPAVQAYYRVIHRLHQVTSLASWSFVGDLPAGPRQVAYDWAPYARTFVLVVEPTWQSMLTARRVARIATARSAARVLTVANKIKSPDDLDRIESFLKTAAVAVVPVDAQVRAAERGGRAPVEHAAGSPAMLEIERLLNQLEEDG
ncbi:MAG: hypothetical protein ACR2NB_09395 [Solirubrobacteraceae bacterium]